MSLVFNTILVIRARGLRWEKEIKDTQIREGSWQDGSAGVAV